MRRQPGGISMKITAIRARPGCGCRSTRRSLAAWDPEPRRHFDATLVRSDRRGHHRVRLGRHHGRLRGLRGPVHSARTRCRSRGMSAVLETISFHAGRYWPLEAALWDIIGQACGQPVPTLFGGAPDRLPAYASFGEHKRPAQRADAVLAAYEAGFRAVKIRIGRDDVAGGLAAVRAARQAAGDDLADHGRPEPVVADGRGHQRRARPGRRPADRGRAGRPGRVLAGGAAARRRPGRDAAAARADRHPGGRRGDGPHPRELLAALDAGRAGRLQPDVVLAVGMLRARTVAELALLRHRWFTPHTWTNGLGLLANLQVVAGVGGGPYLEFPYDPPGWTPERRDFFLTEPVRHRRRRLPGRAAPSRPRRRDRRDGGGPLGSGLRRAGGPPGPARHG